MSAEMTNPITCGVCGQESTALGDCVASYKDGTKRYTCGCCVSHCVEGSADFCPGIAMAVAVNIYGWSEVLGQRREAPIVTFPRSTWGEFYGR